MSDDISIGQRIKKYRQLKKFTQKGLSEKVGRTVSSVQKYEADLVEIPQSTLSKIAEILDVPTDVLRNGEEKVTDPITILLNRLIELTESDTLKWQKEFMEDIQQDSKTYFGQKHKISKREFLYQGASDDEELENLYFLGGLDNDQYYLTKVEDKEKYNLYGFHTGEISHESDLIYFGSTELYPDINKLYISAKLSAEGKHSVYSFLERVKKYDGK